MPKIPQSKTLVILTTLMVLAAASFQRFKTFVATELRESAGRGSTASSSWSASSPHTFCRRLLPLPALAVRPEEVYHV